MKHRVFGKKLGRTRNQRQALFRSQAKAFFTHGFITTTDAKVKALRPLIEKICTLAKKDTLTSRRQIFKTLQDVKLVNSTVEKINKLYPDTNSNFTRTAKVKRRQGDDALVVKFFLFNGYQDEVKTSQKEDKAPKKAAKTTVKKEAKPAAKKATKKVNTKKSAKL